MLHLDLTKVTDAGLDEPAHLPNLKTLYVPKAVTRDGIAQLQKKLPDLKVQR